MGVQKIEITVPEAMVPFMLVADDELQLRQNAMLLYPYIQDGIISHGKAAEILGIHKIDLIVLYGKLGMPYFRETQIELNEDIEAVKRARRQAV